jgi:hypothetical protein
MKESTAGTAMERIGQILEDSLTPSGIDQWLRSRNWMRGGHRPVDLISDGDTARVEEAARAFVDGAYVGLGVLDPRTWIDLPAARGSSICPSVERDDGQATGRRQIGKMDYQAQGVLFLPPSGEALGPRSPAPPGIPRRGGVDRLAAADHPEVPRHRADEHREMGSLRRCCGGPRH